MISLLRFFSLCSLLLVVNFTTGQTIFPNGIAYQAIARQYGGGEVVNQNLSVRISLLIPNNPDSLNVYEEVHDVITNDYGLFHLIIGRGVLTGNGLYTNLEQIPWSSDSLFIKVEADSPMSGSYEFLGTTQLLAVPFAYYAMESGSGGGVTEFSLSGNTLTIEAGGNTYSVDLANGNFDPSSSNELITSMSLSGTMLVIQESGNSISVNLNDLLVGTWQVGGSGIYHSGSNVGINTPNPQSNFVVNGSYAGNVQTIVAIDNGVNEQFALNGTHQIIIANVTDGNIELQLPSAVASMGRIYHIRRFFTGVTSNYQVILSTTNGQSIEGTGSYSLNHPYAEYATLVSDGLNWYLLSHSKE